MFPRDWSMHKGTVHGILGNNNGGLGNLWIVAAFLMATFSGTRLTNQLFPGVNNIILPNYTVVYRPTKRFIVLPVKTHWSPGFQ